MAAATLDRLKSALGSVARGADPRSPYGNLYRAKVRAQRSATRVDVEPDDPAIPAMANIPLKVGVPGIEVDIIPDHVVMVGWENRRPDRPYATTWTPGEDGTVPRRTTVFADTVELGGRGGERLLMGDSYRDAEDELLTAAPAPSLLTAFTTLAGVAVGPLAALQPGLQQAVDVLTSFKGKAAAAGGFLSDVTTTK